MKKPAVPMLHLVMPWLCLASAALLLSSETAGAAQVLRDNHNSQLKLGTSWLSPKTYNIYIDSVRAALVMNTAGEKSNGIPVLRSKNDPKARKKFVAITLVNHAQQSVRLELDVTGASFEAYVAGKYSCHIKSANCSLSSAATPLESSSTDGLPAGVVAGDKDDLEAATRWRADDIDEAITSLFLFAYGNATEQDMRRAVAICDMAIVSAAKFPYIQRRMSAGMWDGNGVSNDPSLHGLQASWPALSAAVQESYQGAFTAPVTIQRSNGKSMQVDNVRGAAPLVSFLQHDQCNRALIRSIVEAAEMGGGGAPSTCGQAEPTLQIVGAEGRCLDVITVLFYSWGQLQLFPCNGNENQLWTFKRDGTIRSKGMCLTANFPYSPGGDVVIDDCPSVPTDHVVWEVRVDGTIVLRSSGLVLGATWLSTWAGIELQRDDRGTGQSWTPTNDAEPLSAPIVGFGDLCLRTNKEGSVWLGACTDNDMVWALFPDGSVRPPPRLFLKWQCLSADAGGSVTTKYCEWWSGASFQRWVFRSDGTIFNTGTGKVLDATPTATPGYYDVVVSSATGSATQQWAVML